MYLNIQKQFEKFYENIILTNAQQEDATTKYSGVCKKLHDHYYPNSEYSGNDKILIGSYGKQTQIRPARDIDVLYILPSDKFDQYNGYESNGQAQLLQDLKNILKAKYPNTIIKASEKVVIIEFADTNHNVELLPGWENTDKTFTIPNSKSGGSWEEWDVRAEIQEVLDSDAKTGKTRTLIRMVKKWPENCNVKVKSFEIEQMVIGFFEDDLHSSEDYPDLVRKFFNYFNENNEDDDVASYLETAVNRAAKACDYENEGKLEDAVDEWAKIFGDDFPASPTEDISKSLSISQATPALADYSHHEALRWPYRRACRVSIDAYVYTPGDRQVAKKLGGLDSNGRNLSPNKLNLKYIASTNAQGVYQVYWQVVNTGFAARQRGGLRGSIFSGHLTQWEKTLYPGKHWIECFIVQNNQCIARSGPFYVNIGQ